MSKRCTPINAQQARRENAAVARTGSLTFRLQGLASIRQQAGRAGGATGMSFSASECRLLAWRVSPEVAVGGDRRVRVGCEQREAPVRARGSWACWVVGGAAGGQGAARRGV